MEEYELLKKAIERDDAEKVAKMLTEGLNPLGWMASIGMAPNIDLSPLAISAKMNSVKSAQVILEKMENGWINVLRGGLKVALDNRFLEIGNLIMGKMALQGERLTEREMFRFCLGGIDWVKIAFHHCMTPREASLENYLNVMLEEGDDEGVVWILRKMKRENKENMIENRPDLKKYIEKISFEDAVEIKEPKTRKRI